MQLAQLTVPIIMASSVLALTITLHSLVYTDTCQLTRKYD